LRVEANRVRTRQNLTAPKVITNAHDLLTNVDIKMLKSASTWRFIAYHNASWVKPCDIRVA